MPHLVTIFCLFLLSVQSHSQIPDSTIARLRSFQSDSERAKYLLKQGIASPELNVAAPHFQLALNYPALEDSLRAEILAQLGSNYVFQFKNDSAGLYLSEAWELATALADDLLQSRIYNARGNLARNMSQNNEAVEAYVDGLRLLGDRKDLEAILQKIKLTGNIAGVYYDLERFEEALSYASQSKKMIYRYAVEEEYFLANLMMAFAFRANDQLDSALFYNQQVIDLIGKNAAPRYYLPHALYNTATIQEKQGYVAASRKTFQEAVAVAREQGESEIEVGSIIALGQSHMAEGNSSSALQFAQQAEQIARENTFLTKLVEALSIKVEAQETLGKFKETLETYKELDILKDSLFNIETVSKIDDINAKYDVKRKETEIQQLTAQNQIKDLQSKQDAQTRLILFIVLGALAIIAALAYARLRSKARTNALLDSKNQELAALNRTKDRLFSIISHDLKSPLSSFHLITKSLSENLDALDKSQLKEYLISLQESAGNIKEMMDNLLKWALAQTDQLAGKVESVDVSKIVDNVLKQMELASQSKSITIDAKVEADLRLVGDSSFFEIVLRNLLSNSLKFTPSGKKVSIVSESDGSAAILRVIDEGVGMDQHEIEELLAGKIIGQEIKNSADKGTGLGITLVNELVKKMNGQLTVSTRKGIGTTFEISFEKAA